MTVEKDSDSERRGYRLPIGGTVFIELEAPPPGQLAAGVIIRCETLDVSPEGLKVALDRPLTTGAILQIGVEIPDNPEPFYLVGQVRWRRQLKQSMTRWTAGLEILNAAGSDRAQWLAALQLIGGHTQGADPAKPLRDPS